MEDNRINPVGSNSPRPESIPLEPMTRSVVNDVRLDEISDKLDTLLNALGTEVENG